MDLIVTAVEVKGNCPMYKVGDSFRLEDGYRLVSEIPVCMHALAALIPHYNALRVSSPDQWGLARKGDGTGAYVQCLDPHEYTGGGTTIFQIVRSG